MKKIFDDSDLYSFRAHIIGHYKIPPVQYFLLKSSSWSLPNLSMVLDAASIHFNLRYPVPVLMNYGIYFHSTQKTLPEYLAQQRYEGGEHGAWCVVVVSEDGMRCQSWLHGTLVSKPGLSH